MTKEERAYNYASTRKATKLQVGEIAKFYNDGYEQAEKDTFNKAKKWLAEIHKVCDITDENGYRIELRDLVASFEKAIKDEL